MSKVIIYGNSSMAAIVVEYLEQCPDHEVVAYTQESEYCTEPIFEGKPLVPLKNLPTQFPKESHVILVLTTFGLKNPRHRKKEVCSSIKSMGYSLFSFIDSNAFVAKSAKIGENVVVLRGCTVEPKAELSDGVFLRPDVYVSHESKIGEYTYVAPRACIAGRVKVGAFCFIGVNSTIRDMISVGNNAIVGAGAIVLKSVPDFGVIKGATGTLLDKDSSHFNV
jgi:sugar O-acyltransferase (sialic acid O-acetyltransferase NeuD family)